MIHLLLYRLASYLTGEHYILGAFDLLPLFKMFWLQRLLPS